MYRIIAIVITILTAAGARAEGHVEWSNRMVDSLENELKIQKTAADSTDVLYDLFDVVLTKRKPEMGRRLLDAALKTGNTATILDAYRRYGAVIIPSEHAKILELAGEVERMPRNPEQQATKLFLKMQYIQRFMDNTDEATRQLFVHEYFNTVDPEKEGNDTYRDIETQFLICRFLLTSVSSDMLNEYMIELGRMIEQMPYKLTALRNMYYVSAAHMFSGMRQEKQSLHADSVLLGIIDQLDAENKAAGRKFRKYDTYRYQVYRRMLGNFRSLTLEQVDDLWAKVNELAKINGDVNHDMQNKRQPELFYLMAHKRYPEALQAFKQTAPFAATSWQNRMIAYELYLEAAQAMNDREAMADAAIGYNKLLKENLHQRMLERNREVMVHKELSDVRENQLRIEAANHANEQRYHSRLVTILSIAVGILVIALIFIVLSFRSTRKMSRSLAKSNAQLRDERDTLQRTQKELIQVRDHARKADRHKTEFINNMSHEVRHPLNAIIECSHIIADNVPEEKRRYLHKYSQMLDIAVEMLRMIVSDVLDLAQLDNNQMEIHRSMQSVNNICTIAVDAIRKHVQEGVTMEYVNPNEGNDLQIITDPVRVEQVLANLLHNAAKFTEHGKIELSYQLDPTNSKITFSVTDTGIGIPAGKEEIIFKRFEKLSSLTPGTGLGLNICRMIATLMGGSVRVDTTYEGPGARLLFTLTM